MKKRFLTGVLSLTLMFIMAIPTFATEIATPLYEKELENLAYMDLETADPTLESKILEARNEVVLNTSWVADGIRGYVVDKNNNILKEVPQFHDVFPSDWDIPVFPVDKTTPETMVTPQADSGSWEPGSYLVDLKAPPTNRNTKPFTHFMTHGFVDTPYEYMITQVTTSGYCSNTTIENPTYNVGYSNYNTGASLGLCTRMDESESFTIDTPLDIEVAVRASTYSAPGSWTLFVACYRIDVNQ